jgi:hypothetical protein
MTAPSLILVCSLLGQVTAAEAEVANPQPPASGRYGDVKNTPRTAGEPRYGNPRAGSPGVERRASNEVVAGDPGVAAQPSTDRGSELLRRYQEQRDRFENGGGVVVADDDPSSEPIPLPRDKRAPAAPIDAAGNALRGGPLTPQNAPADRGVVTPRNDVPARDAPDVRPPLTPDVRPPLTPDTNSKAHAPADTDLPANTRILPDTSAVPGGGGEATVRDGPLGNRTTEELFPPETPPRRLAASAIDALAVAFAVPEANVVAGAPLKLADALARRSDRDSRLAISHAYWKLSAATAAHAFAVDEQRRIANLAQTAAAAPEIDRRLIDSVLAAAEARVHETLLVVVSAQHDLAEAVGGAAGEALPLASDTPYLGVYATRFDQIFVDRAAPTQLRAIHDTLPTLYKAVGRRADAATTAIEAFSRAEQLYVRGQIGIDALLAAFHQAGAQRQAFLAVARAYNDDIADYAINVAREGTGAAELTSMLIRVSTSDANDAARRTTPPVARSAENPRRGVAVDRSQPVVGRSGSSVGAPAAGWQPKNVGP